MKTLKVFRLSMVTSSIQLGLENKPPLAVNAEVSMRLHWSCTFVKQIQEFSNQGFFCQISN